MYLDVQYSYPQCRNSGDLNTGRIYVQYSNAIKFGWVINWSEHFWQNESFEYQTCISVFRSPQCHHKRKYFFQLALNLAFSINKSFKSSLPGASWKTINPGTLRCLCIEPKHLLNDLRHSPYNFF
jgi:hypothetical protein